MATVDPGYAEWLKSEALFVTATPGSAAMWGAKALDSSITSAISYKADAQNEAISQAQFLAGPLAIDKAVVQGLRRDLVGRAINLTADRLGYENGPTVFVLGAAESDTVATTTLTVLKRL